VARARVRRVLTVALLLVVAGAAAVLVPGAPYAAPPPRGTPVLVALGDSVPAGTACACLPFPVQAARGLGPTAVARDLARPGEDVPGLLAQLEEPDTADALRSAGGVTVTVGANDFDEDSAEDDRCSDPSACWADELAGLREDVPALLDRLDRLVPAGVPVVVTGYWDVFRDGDVAAAKGPAYVRSSAALTDVVNGVLAGAAHDAGATYLDLAGPFSRSGDITALLAADGDHPDARGHRLIAEQLVPLLRRRAG
jgi:lysophospholipase L1-like esterase